MATEVTITGTLYDRVNRTSQNVVLIGEAMLSGSPPVEPPVEPPGIWPSPGRPAHPIVRPGRPPGIWGPTDPRPTPPIALPPGWEEPPTEPPDTSGPDWKWVWNPTTDWIPAFVPEGGKPQPIPPPPAQPK